MPRPPKVSDAIDAPLPRNVGRPTGATTGRPSPEEVVRISGAVLRRADRSEIRRNNLAVVIRHLALGGRASKAEIASGTGLTNSTVARLVAELHGLGLVREIGPAPTRGAGRPGAWVELDGTQLLTVGCEMNVDRMVVRICDLGGRLRSHLVRDIDTAEMSAATATKRLARLCHQTITQATSAEPHATIVNVVAAIPGIVDDFTNTVIAAPNLHWTNFPLGRALYDALALHQVEVIVGNDANFAALAEFWSGLHTDIDDLVYLTGDIGIGGGLIVGGRLLASANGQAGEVGHMTLDPAGPLCACGRRGCWESYIGLDALRRELGPSYSRTSPSKLIADVARRATAQDLRTLAALASVGTWLGVGLSNLINLLGSQRVVVGGYFAELSAWILPSAQESLREHVFINQPIDRLVTMSTLGSSAAATGAALYGVDKLLSNPLALHGQLRHAAAP